MINPFRMLLSFVVLIGGAGGVAAEEPKATKIRAQVIYETTEGIYVDPGAVVLEVGGDGWLDVVSGVGAGERIARFEITTAARGSALLRLELEPGKTTPDAGDVVRLWLEVDLPPAPEPEPEPVAPIEEDAPTTLKPLGEEIDTDLPLLAPRSLSGLVQTDPINIFHGRVSFRQLFQAASEADLSSSRTHLRTSGSLDRIDGTPWAFEWSGDLSYRAGDAYEFVADFQEVRFQAYRLAFFRRFDDRSTIRFGHFLPGELPGVGYIDGWQGEKVLEEGLRVGAILGFKSYRDDLDPTLREPTVVPYATFRAGRDTEKSYSATAGLLASLYKGKPDRLAFLLDQTARLGRLTLLASSEVDVDIGGAEIRSGVRLTRLNLSTNFRLASAHVLRAGVDRYETPDTEAERNLVDDLLLVDTEFFEDEYSRYWLGASHDLSDHWSLDERVSFTDSTIDDDYRWRLSLTRHGLPGVPDGNLGFHVFRLAGDEIEGVGGRITSSLPFRNHTFFIEPSLAFRWAEFELESESFIFSEASVRTHWLISDSWSFTGGVSVALTDDDHSLSADFGITLRW